MYNYFYPRGNRNELSYAYVDEYEMSDWDLASRIEFDDVEECQEHMLDLAKKHRLQCRDGTAYLD